MQTAWCVSPHFRTGSNPTWMGLNPVGPALSIQHRVGEHSRAKAQPAHTWSSSASPQPRRAEQGQSMRVLRLQCPTQWLKAAVAAGWVEVSQEHPSRKLCLCVVSRSPGGNCHLLWHCSGLLAPPTPHCPPWLLAPALLHTPVHPCTPSSPALITPSTLKYPRTSTTPASLCPASPPASTAHTACTPQIPAPPAPLQPAPESSLPPVPEPSHRHHLGKLSLKQAPGQSTASKATKAVTGP